MIHDVLYILGTHRRCTDVNAVNEMIKSTHAQIIIGNHIHSQRMFAQHLDVRRKMRVFRGARMSSARGGRADSLRALNVMRLSRVPAHSFADVHQVQLCADCDFLFTTKTKSLGDLSSQSQIQFDRDSSLNGFHIDVWLDNLSITQLGCRG